MKKIAIMILCIIFTLSFLGCGIDSKKEKGSSVEEEKHFPFIIEEYESLGGYVIKGLAEESSEIVIPTEYEGIPIVEIAENAFYKREDIEVVVFKDGVKRIGKLAFAGCTNLKELVLPNTLEACGNAAFRDCTLLEEVVIPGSLKEISCLMFTGCSSLWNVEIKNGVEKIGGYDRVSSGPFGNCSIERIIIPKSVSYISKGSFSNNPLKQAKFENTYGWKGADDSLLTDDVYFSEKDLANQEYAAKILLMINGVELTYITTDWQK